MVKGHRNKRTTHKNKKTSKGSKHSKGKNMKGGMLTGALEAAKTALLPFLLYTAQKRLQNRPRRTRATRRTRRGTRKSRRS